MEERLISFETAKLAKEKGYDWIYGVKMGNVYYDHNGELDYSAVGDFKIHRCLATTQSLLKKWLREKYNIEVEVYRTTESDTGEKYGCEGNDWNAKTDEEFDLFNFYDKEFEDVFEKGLYEALKSI